MSRSSIMYSTLELGMLALRVPDELHLRGGLGVVRNVTKIQPGAGHARVAELLHAFLRLGRRSERADDLRHGAGVGLALAARRQQPPRERSCAHHRDAAVRCNAVVDALQSCVASLAAAAPVSEESET